MQLNKVDAQFCARCGQPLEMAPLRVSRALKPASYWILALVFAPFFLMVFMVVSKSVGMVSFVFVPFVLIGLRKVAKNKEARRNTGVYGADFRERHP